MGGHRETGQRRTRLNRSQRVEHPSAQEKKLNVLNDKRIKYSLSRFDCGAYSCLQFLRAVGHSVGAHTESLQPRVDNSSSNNNNSEDEDENRQAPELAAPTSGASESATAAAATTSDDCCKVCIVAPRTGFALVPCGHRTRRQYTRQRKLLEIDLSVNHTINHYFIVRPNVVQRAGQLSLPHVAISKTERNRTTNIKPMSSSYNTP